MGQVTGIEPQKGKKERVNLFIDGRFALGLDRVYLEEKGLEIGTVLSDVEIESLVETDGFMRTYEAALRFLSYRPRSEMEVRRRLHRGQFADAQIEKVIARLKELGTVNDVSFARFWTESRSAFNPRGRRLINMELRQKGVDSGITQEATSEVDEETDVYRVAEKKARTIQSLDYNEFRDKLGSFLQRRGYSYALVKRVVDEIWQDKSKEQPPETSW